MPAQRFAPWAVLVLAVTLSCTGPPSAVAPGDDVMTEVGARKPKPTPTPVPTPTPRPSATPTATPSPDPTTVPNATPTPQGVYGTGQLDVRDGTVVDTTAPETIRVAP